MPDAGQNTGPVLLDEHSAPPAVAALAADQMAGDVRFADGKTCRYAFHNNDKPLSVGLACREKPDHSWSLN